jgi:4'-phosphopantetheinyl transferase
MQDLQALTESDVYVWWTDIHSRNQEIYDEFVSADEKRQAERFLTTKTKRDYLFARGFVRKILANYTSQSPKELRFCKSSLGKPALIKELGIKQIEFNLSRTAGLLVVALGMNRNIGVDVEDCERRLDISQQAGLTLDDSELEYLSQQNFEQQARVYWRLWTLKESLLKGVGYGLGISPKKITIENLGERDKNLSYSYSGTEISGEWQFGCYCPTSRHQIAVAAEKTNLRDLNIEFIEASHND